MKNLKIVLSIIVLTLICVTAVYYAFCPAKKSAETKNEVVFWSLQMGTFENYMKPLISQFEKENPEIRIKWIDVPYSEGEKRTLASILSNNPPDLVNLTPDFSAVLAQKQALEYIDCEKLENYNPQIIEMLKTNGKCYAVPFYATSALTFYNKELVKAANLKEIPQNFDDLFAVAPKIKEKTAKFVTMPTLTENDTFLKILNKYDINLAEKLTDEKSLQLFDAFKTLYKHDFVPKESITQNHQEALEKYMSGQLVFIQSGANFLNIVKENAPQVFEKTDVSRQLTGDNGKFDVSIMNLIIPAKAKNKDAALKFALFLTNKTNQIELAKLTSILPVNNEALKDEYFTKYKDSDVIAKARFLSAQQLNNLQTPVRFKKGQKEIINLLNMSVQQIMLEKAPAKQILDKTKTQWKKIEG